jgi:signal transduction histidine kinase
MVFSKNGINNKGFLGAKIVGRIDSNNDGKKEYLIHIKGKRWINELLICYDEEKRQIIWKKEIIYGISDNIKIYDIDKDGIEEILFSTIAYCNEFPIDWFRKKEVGESYYSYFYILDNNGKIKIINNKPAVVKSECGLYKFHYLPLFKQDKVLLAFSSSSEKIEKRIMVYDLKKNEIKELEISYNNITNFYFEDKNIIAIDNYKRRLSKIIISKDLKLKKIFITNSPYNIGDYPPNRIIIDNKKYSMLTIPVLIVDDKLNTLYKSPYQISCSSIHLNNNKIYFKELDKNKTYLSSLTFFRNKKLNPYIIIILLVEILLLISYLFIFQIIKIPLNTGTSSYFVLYTIFGRFYYWQLHGRLKNIYKLPKNVALSKEIPEKIFRDIAEEIKIVFERSFLLFKYKVYEILSHDEFQIIQRISHDLKNQVLLTKLELEQFEKESTKLLSKNKSDSFFKNMNSSFKEISNAAAILSSFSHIKKLYKEQIDMKDYIEFMLSKYLNHPYYDNIEIEFKNTISALSLDKNLMEICFRNLLNNALETIIEKDKIKIEVSEIHETVIIEIKNPCSIPPCDHEKFYQIGFSTKDTGSGLGIPISKTIIEKHDGTLSINCENNEFIVTILLPKINEL